MRTSVADRATIRGWMKISCQACAAKYTIADEKVLGKIVKIRCKKCGATIVVNGNDPGSAVAAPPGAYDYGARGTHGNTWTVNVADGDQRTMTDQEIVDAYRAGVVSDETFCWKDGMTDWLPVLEIEQLYAECSATRAASPPSGMAPNDGGVTKTQEVGPGIFGSSPPGAAYAAPRPAAGNGAVASGAAPAAAARRAGGRAPAADLFGGAAQAGGEEDVMTSAPVGMPDVHDEAQKLTGQRNENSVLFSLNALTSKGPGPAGGGQPLQAPSEASGLIDIRQLSAQLGMGDDKKKSRIDDIMNLAGGGAFSPSLAAPVLSAPPIEEYGPSPEAGATGQLPAAGTKSRAVIFGAVAAGVVVIAVAVGAAVMIMGKAGTADKDNAAASATTASAAIPATPAAMTAPSATATPSDTAAASGAPSDTSTAATAAAKTAATTTPTPKSTTTTAAVSTAPTATTTTAATTTATAPAAAGASDQPFNMGEAKARLASIAGSVQGCKKGDVSGTGRVVVTFAPAGNVASAVVSGPPFAGTPTGACVSSRFRGAHVPAFSGSPFSVSKSFTIN
jgi:predicted Zn finger-like uncharacterized protein